MTPGELAAVRGRLEEFAAEMFAPLSRSDQRDKGATYVRGLLLEGRRKSMQPMAGASGWWQVGAEQAQLVVEVTSGERLSRLVSTMFGLARDGHVDARGLPHLLQAAVSLTAYRDAVVFASPPPLVQRLLFGVLAPLGRLLGKQPVYPEYLFGTDLAEPPPEALALLDKQGRLQLGAAIEG